MSPIGGYFELTLPQYNSVYHEHALAFNLCRSAFEFVLATRRIKHVHLPYYLCDVMLQPIRRLSVDAVYYHINHRLEPVSIPTQLAEDELFVYINYFGIKGEYIANELLKHTNSVLLDYSQAFYDTAPDTIPTIYSPRKFFGLPDGGFLYPVMNEQGYAQLSKDISHDRSGHLLQRMDEGAEAGFNTYKLNDMSLSLVPMRKMSTLTHRLLSAIDFDAAKKSRQSNFKQLHSHLAKFNVLSDAFCFEAVECAMVYPFLIDQGNELRAQLIRSKIFVATYWPGVKELLRDKDAYEVFLVDNLVPLPIDHRYTEGDMSRILNLIFSFLGIKQN